MEKLTFVYVILLVAGAVPIFMCIIKMNMLKNFKKKAVEVQATITNIEKRIGFRGSRYYLLTLEYMLAGTDQLWNAKSVLFKKHQQGDKIPLWYLADKPAKYSIDNGKRYPVGIILSILFFLLIVCLCYWLSNLNYSYSGKSLTQDSP